ncbi:MAG TPA: type II secretion system major pseudopilin GspG [Myxococcota bacterium]|nr:type II secretion system major pseudopilin GspG [Myxococcota bacterium]
MHAEERDLRRNDGFTLLEIMVVVLIIGLLMTVLATNLFSRLGRAESDIAKMQVTKLSQQLELYKLDNGTYPTTEQGLDALVHEPTTEPRARRYPPGGYVTSKDIEDPWHNPFKYERPGKNNTQSFDLYTYGGDNQPGGDGENADVGNWETTAAQR